MLFIWISLWVLTFIIFKINDDNKDMRWIASLCFFAGLGALCSILRKQVYPSLDFSPEIKHSIKHTIFFIHSFSYVFAPYSFAVYSVLSSKWLVRKAPFFYSHAKKILFVPPLLMYLIYPIQFMHKAPFFALCLWVIPYCIFSNALMIISYFNEKNKEFKRQKLFTIIIITPPTIFVTISNYIMTAVGNHIVWGYNSVAVFVLVSVFIVASVKYGVMGVRVKFEKNKYESTRKSITSGTAILTHSIKNEITKISICTENLKHYINTEQNIFKLKKVSIDDFNQIDLSYSHMTNMMKTINNHLSEISLNIERKNLVSLIEESLLLVKPLLQNKKILVKRSFELEVDLECDPLHIKETLINIFKNSIEAMSQEGFLTVHTYNFGKWIVVEINDDGDGIDNDNMAYIFEPFFSTKRTCLNYGLGLSYCYNVMDQHGGKLEVSSSKGIGTTVCLNFNIKNAHILNISNSKEVILYGENKNFTC